MYNPFYWLVIGFIFVEPLPLMQIYWFCLLMAPLVIISQFEAADAKNTPSWTNRTFWVRAIYTFWFIEVLIYLGAYMSMNTFMNGNPTFFNILQDVTEGMSTSANRSVTLLMILVLQVLIHKSSRSQFLGFPGLWKLIIVALMTWRVWYEWYFATILWFNMWTGPFAAITNIGDTFLQIIRLVHLTVLWLQIAFTRKAIITGSERKILIVGLNALFFFEIVSVCIK